MDVKAYNRKNRRKMMMNRLRHPWPLYKRVGGINAVVIRANGNREELGEVAVTYAKRWNAGSGQ